MLSIHAWDSGEEVLVEACGWAVTDLTLPFTEVTASISVSAIV